jgi:hypothetical protein
MKDINWVKEVYVSSVGRSWARACAGSMMLANTFLVLQGLCMLALMASSKALEACWRACNGLEELLACCWPLCLLAGPALPTKGILN